MSQKEKELIQAIYRERSLGKLNREDLARSIQKFSTDMNKHALSFLYEIIQNAHDYPNKKDNVNVTITINHKHLIIEHDGAPFTEEHVQSICRVFQSTKNKHQDKIGYKGIGFKSIFTISDLVYIKSGGYSFRFDKGIHKDQLPFPWEVAPIWTEPTNTSQQSSNVYIECLLIEGKHFGESILSALTQAEFSSTSIVFLPKIERLHVKIHDKDILLINSNSSKSKNIRFDKTRIPIPDPIQQELRNNDLIPHKLQKEKHTEISYATSTTNTITSGGIFVFLPTQIKTGLPFHINANFIPDVSRHDLHNNLQWNRFLIREAGIHLISWINALITSKQTEIDPFSLIPTRSVINMGNWSEPFVAGVKEGLNLIPIVPCTDGTIHTIADVCIDQIGIFELLQEKWMPPIIGVDKPIAVSSDSVHNGVRRLTEFLDNGNGPQILKWDNVHEAWQNDRIKNWLSEPKNCRRAIEFLDTKGQQNEELHCIIPNEQGNFQSIKNTYTNFPGDPVLAYCLDIHVAKQGIFRGDEDRFNLPVFSPSNYIKEILCDIPRIGVIENRFKEFENRNGLLQYLYHNQRLLSREDYDLIRSRCGIQDETGQWHKYISKIDNAFIFNPLIEPIAGEGKIFNFNLIGKSGPLANSEDEFTWLEFLKETGVPQLDPLILQKDWLAPHIADTSSQAHPWRAQETQNLVWRYLYDGWTKLPDDEQKELKKLCEETTVLTSNGALVNLKECSPIGETEIEELVKKFNLEHHFLSTGYPIELQEYLKILGAKSKTRSLVEPILSKLPDMDNKSIIQAIRFLYQFKDHTAISTHRDESGFELVTDSGDRRPITDCLLQPKKQEDCDFNDLPYPQEHVINKEYFQHQDREKWIAFLEHLGLDQGETNSIRIRLKAWVANENNSPSPPETRSLIWNRIASLSSQSRLNKETLNALSEIHLYAIDTMGLQSMQPAAKCHLGSHLSPTHDLQKLLRNKKSKDLWFVTETAKTECNQLSDLFIKIGVNDPLQISTETQSNSVYASNLGNNYCEAIQAEFPAIRNNSYYLNQHRVITEIRMSGIEFLEDPEVAIDFWGKSSTLDGILPALTRPEEYRYYYFGGTHKTAQVPNRLLVQLRTMPCIPVEGGGNAVPQEIAAPHLEHLVPNAPRATINLKAEINETPLWKLLRCKEQLSLDECLTAIPNGKWNSSRKSPEIAKQIIQAIKDENVETLQSKIAQFNTEAKWPNAHGKLKHTKELAVFGPDITPTSIHRDIILHPSLIEIAQEIGIKVLFKQDVQTKPELPGEEIVKPLLIHRLAHLAQVTNSFDPETRAQDWAEKLEPLKLIGVDSIGQTIVEPQFHSDHLQEHSEGDYFYYIRPHTSLNALELVSKLQDLFELKEEELWALKDVVQYPEKDWDRWLVKHGLKDATETKPAIESQPESSTEPNPETPPSVLEEPKPPVNAPPKIEPETKQVSDAKYLWFDGLSGDQRDRLNKLMGNDLTREHQMMARIEALFRGLEYFEEQGWELDTHESSDPFTRAIRDRHPLVLVNNHGVLLRVFCRSAKGGILWLGSHPWNMLDNELEKHELFVITGSEPDEFEHFQKRNELVMHHVGYLGHEGTLIKISDYNFDENESDHSWDLEMEAQKLMPNEHDGGSNNLHFLFLVKSDTKRAENMIGLFKTNRDDEYPT